MARPADLLVLLEKANAPEARKAREQVEELTSRAAEATDQAIRRGALRKIERDATAAIAGTEAEQRASLAAIRKTAHKVQAMLAEAPPAPPPCEARSHVHPQGRAPRRRTNHRARGSRRVTRAGPDDDGESEPVGARPRACWRSSGASS